MFKRSYNYLKVRSSFNSAKYSKLTPSKNNLINVLSVLNTNPGKTPCIYLIRTTKFSDGVEEDSAVYKFGYTNDLARRLLEHEKRYGVDIDVELFSHVPEYYLRDAEKDLKHYFQLCNYTYYCKNYFELIKLKEQDIPLVTKFYENISEKYTKNLEIIVAENILLKKILKVE